MTSETEAVNYLHILNKVSEHYKHRKEDVYQFSRNL